MREYFFDFRRTVKGLSKNVKQFIIIIFLLNVASSSLGILQGIYLKNLGFDESLVGTLLSLRTLGISIGAFLAIFILNRLGKKKSMYLATFGLILSGLFMINLPVAFLMNLMSFIFGVSQAIFTVVQSPFLHENSTRSNVVATFSIAFVATNAAAMVSNIFLGIFSDCIAHFTSDTFGNQTVLNLSLLLLLFILPRLMKISEGECLHAEEDLPESPHGGKSSFLHSLRSLDKHSMLYLLHVSFIGIGAGLVVPFFSMYLKFTLEISDSAVGIIMSFSQFGTVLGGLIVPALTKKFGRVKTVIFCQAMSIPFLLSISFPQGIFIMSVSFFFRSALMNMANPVIESMAMDLVKEETRTLMSSMFQVLNNLFRALGVYAGGNIMAAVSYNFPYYITILFYLFSLIIIFTVFGRDEKYR